MTDTTLDCKGLACPQPVLQCKQCIDNDSPKQLNVIVDNDAALQNVTRFMESKGYEVQSTPGEGFWTITGTAGESANAVDCECEVLSDKEIAALSSKITVFIPTDVIGSGDDELGGKLMLNFLGTLPELGDELWRIVLVNAGVKLSATDHSCFEKLKALEEMGATILVCGTCLEHFELMDAKGVGQTTNMLDVVTSMQLATKVIRV